LKVKSKALEVNLADYHVDVDIDPQYAAVQEAMSRYYGLSDGLNTFLRELSHPYRNWRFIVAEGRKYALDYFHLLQPHPQGPEAARRYVDIFLAAAESAKQIETRSDAIDNLMLYLKKILTDSADEFDRFRPVVDRAFEQIRMLPSDIFDLFVHSYYPFNRLAAAYLDATGTETIDLTALNRLLADYLARTYGYWLNQDDPQTWFEADAADIDWAGELDGHFENISHDRIHAWRLRLEQLAGNGSALASPGTSRSLLELPGFNHFIDQYRRVPRELLARGESDGRGHHLKLLFLFHIMNISGLSLIHEETLRDINQTLSWIIVNENIRNIQKLITKTFSILKKRTHSFPATALGCVLNMGRGVYKIDNIDLINFFIDSVIDLGFQSPMLKGVDNEWQTKANHAHILNIRTWLELIELNPKWSTRLMSALILHLSLSGVYIRDIDLFPRDITQLLNSGISPIYNLAKQLARLLPAFFNDIGAEGRLRDISTRIDEINQRRDILVHFLRKQSHVESSNRIVSFMEAVLSFWMTGEKEVLLPYLPPNIYASVDEKGRFVDGMRSGLNALAAAEWQIPQGLLRIQTTDLEAVLAGTEGVGPVDVERIKLAVELYKLLNQKYKLDGVELKGTLAHLRTEALPELDRVDRALDEPDLKRQTFMLLDYLDKLKGIILSEGTYEIRQDIYKKRHITIDIPSMYGSYHEMKFDCLGLTLRLESMIRVSLEALIDAIDLSLITKATFFEIYSLLRLFEKALKLDGITSVEFERNLEFLAHSLEVRGFTLTQYLDIFKGFAQAVKNIVNDYFNNVHTQNLNRILDQLPIERLLPKFVSHRGIEEHEKRLHRVSEIFFRDQIAFSLGLQQLDLFLSRILSTLFQQSYKLPKDKLRQLLLYDPHNTMVPVDSPKSRVTGIIQLGNKGLNLVKLKGLGFPIPAAFIVTTEAFRGRDMIESYAPAEQNFKEQLARQIACLEKASGKKFGDPHNPLLLSVRSGSSISQPGMMDTLLNVGNSEDISAGLARKTGNEWFAWDNYRRFLQCYGMAYHLERDDFDAVINHHKRLMGIGLKREFTGGQMRTVALAYKKMIQDAGIEIIESPLEQLYLAIRIVLSSWESAKAKTYRRIMGISDDWGTAVTVQEMVYGNLSRQSGTGVIFTHNPRWSPDTPKLWGDFTIGNQGEDVVSGLVSTMPISMFQQEIEMRETDITLETHFPDIFSRLKEWSHLLIDEEGWSPQEIEFTFESKSVADLYLLQTRDMAIRERKKVIRFDFDELSEDAYLGHGIGVSGGAMSGRLVFTLEEIEKWRLREPGTQLILARADTVPDDIRQIHSADGLLTARGGLTSHAAVVAHRLGKTCVVGCSNLICHERDGTCLFNQRLLKSGDFISIDGQEGSVYDGLIKVEET
jgi:pyruvate,orthophosphate dikinase